MNIWKIPTIEEFIKFIDISRLSKFNDTNLIVINKVMENAIPFDWDMNFLNEPKKEYGDLITLFDEYKLDGKSPSRILNFLEEKYD